MRLREVRSVRCGRWSGRTGRVSGYFSIAGGDLFGFVFQEFFFALGAPVLIDRVPGFFHFKNYGFSKTDLIWLFFFENFNCLFLVSIYLEKYTINFSYFLYQ